jgi:hypothetical protein
MTEEKAFEPITTQEVFDERIKARLAREREKWEKESSSGAEELKAEIAAKDEEISQIKREHYLENTKRALLQELDRREVLETGRRERIMKLVDLEAIEASEDGSPSREHILEQVDGVAQDLPELVRPRGAGSRGSSKPVVPQEKPITRDELEKMDEAQINSRWDAVKAFMAGER